MKGDDQIATALLAIIMGLVVLIGLAISVTEPICAEAKIEISAPEKVQFGCFEFWLNRYQTLIAGIAALLAAGVSVHYLRHQIAQADKHRRDQIARDQAAARTVLPLALSAICQYATASFNALRFGDGDGGAQLPQVPENALLQITEIVRTLDRPRTIYFAKLAQDIQVHASRMASLGDISHLNDENLAEHRLDAAEIYARASSLFDFARMDTDELPETLFADEVKSALFVTGLERDRTGPCHQLIDRRPDAFPIRKEYE